MDAMLHIAAARQQEKQAVAADERLAAHLRRDRAPLATVLARVTARLRAPAPAAGAAPCPSC